MAVGGMAEIYLSRQRSEGAMRPVVIKLMHAHLMDDDVRGGMFLDELRIGMRLSHPNICHIYDVGREGEDPYIVMEWVDGVTLSKLRKRLRGAPPIHEMAKMISHTAGALDYAHRLKDETGRPLDIVHRDVSPQNIMVSFGGNVKLLDFGIARMQHRLTTTAAGSLKGKLAYLSPEQAMGRPIDSRSDVFSLGTCFYEAVTGKRLFDRKTEFEMLDAIVNGDPPNVRRVQPDVPAGLAEIIEKCLQRPVGSRYQTCRELQRAIDSFLSSEGELVDSGRLADLMGVLFAPEIAAGPKMDHGASIAARFVGNEKKRTPASRLSTNRYRWLLVAVAGVLSGSLAWFTASDDPPVTEPVADVEEPTAAVEEPTELDAPTPPNAEEIASVSEVTTPTMEDASLEIDAGDVAAGDMRPTSMRRRRRRQRMRGPMGRVGGFVNSPGF